MTEHTPGPWSVGPWFDNYGEPEIIIEHKTDAGNLVIAVALGGLVGQEANARLIAAAPELLEAVRDSLSVCQSVSISRDRQVVRDGCVSYMQTEEWCKWLEDDVAPKLRAAIAKATGEHHE
jgi:hypothetical protein